MIAGLFLAGIGLVWIGRMIGADNPALAILVGLVMGMGAYAIAIS
jgi:uncharacterized membrane protein